MRTDTAGRGTGGVARYSHERGLIPRLGLFAGHEAQIPYDFHELLGTIAPRPVLVVQPQLDRDASPADVRTAVEEARKISRCTARARTSSCGNPGITTAFPKKPRMK